jgi:hypothetical protein
MAEREGMCLAWEHLCIERARVLRGVVVHKLSRRSEWALDDT